MQESQARRESEAQLMKVIEEKFYGALKQEVSRESRARYDSVEQLKGCLENDFPKLQDMIRQESQ